ncbi:cupin domain-containing protein [bacterium]|nr:cupin domain-containing protein [bacterium]
MALEVRPAAGARVIRPLELASHHSTTAGIARLPGITHELVGADRLWMGVTVLEPGAVIEPHHHGNHEAGVYVVAGRFRVRWGERLETEAELEAGDLVYLPPLLPHEETNPSPDEPAVVVVVWSGSRVYVPLEAGPDGIYRPTPTNS